MRRALLVPLLVAAGAGLARAEDKIPVKQYDFAEKNGQLVMSASYTDVFNQERLEELSSGVVTTVRVRVWVYKEAQELPVGFAQVTYRVSYDLWAEVYNVRAQINVDKPEDSQWKTRADALKKVTTMADLPIAPLSVVEVGKRHFVGMIVDVNPVSPELLAEVRKWLARPQGDVGPGNSSSFFGSFVSVFANPKVPEADFTQRTRTGWIWRPPR